MSKNRQNTGKKEPIEEGYRPFKKGYQPTQGNLDTTDPPQGGSGVHSEPSKNDNDKKTK